MREDYSLQLLYSQRNYSVDEPLGCCEIANKNTAGTTTQQECSEVTGGKIFFYQHCIYKLRKDDFISSHFQHALYMWVAVGIPK